MKRMVVCIWTALLCGCATTAPQQSLAPARPPVRTFNASKSTVWQLLVAEVGLNYPVQAIEKESGLLTTAFVMLPTTFNNGNMGQWVNPPGGFLATWNGLRMNLRAMVTEADGKTTVNLQPHYEAFENNVRKGWVVCQSNGQLENGILDRIEQQLPPAK